jgi:hypothetical protein
VEEIKIDWTPPKLDGVTFSLTHPCGCTKIVEYSLITSESTKRYTRPIGSGECPGMGCLDHRGRTTFV